MGKNRELHLISDRADAIQLYLWQLRDLMGLGRWDVYLGAKRAPKGCLASVLPCEGRAVANVSVSKHWWDLPAHEQRDTLVHELIHLVHRDQTDLIRCAAMHGLDRTTYRVLWEAHRLATEVMVDHLTSIIAPTMPLPDFSDTPTATLNAQASETTEEQ